jgi:hypothetical protein
MDYPKEPSNKTKVLMMFESLNKDDLKFTTLANKVAYGSPTVEDLIEVSMRELWEAMAYLPPSKNIDGWHAGCCAFRTISYLRQLHKMLGFEDKTINNDS